MTRARVEAFDLLAGLPRVPRSPASYVPNSLHAKQVQFLGLTQLEALYGGAAGGGKTEALLADALQFVHEPRYSALMLRRTFPALRLRGSVMQRALEWLGREFWHDDQKRFVFPSGATIQFGYCDSEGDLDRYKSAQFHRIYIDEITEWPEAWATFLFSRIRRTKGDRIPLGMRAATNPDGMGAEWVRRRFGIPEGATVDEAITNAEEDRIFLPARADDNPALDLASYEKALSKLNPAKYQQLRWGRWIRDGEGLVYAHFEASKNVIAAAPACDSFVLGIDYGFTDATAFAVVGWRKHDSTVYVVSSEKHRGMTPSVAAEHALALEKRYKFAQIVGDTGGLGKGYVEEARTRFMLPIEPAEKTNKRGYIDLLNGELKAGNVQLVEATTRGLVKEWNELPWHSDRAREADGFDNHESDATLYAWRACSAFVERPQERPPAQGTREYDAAMVEAGREARRRENDRQQRNAGIWRGGNWR